MTGVGVNNMERVLFPLLVICETTEELVHGAIQNEKRKRLVHLRQTSEQKRMEVRSFTSICFCEMAEEVAVGARQYEKRNELVQL